MAKYESYCVVAYNLVDATHLHGLDQSVPGVYSVEVDCALPEAKAAAVALDVFHATCAVKRLDDFRFIVFDPYTLRVLDPDVEHEPYSGLHLGRDCEFCRADLPTIYDCSVVESANLAAHETLGSLAVVSHGEQLAQYACRRILLAGSSPTRGESLSIRVTARSVSSVATTGASPRNPVA